MAWRSRRVEANMGRDSGLRSFRHTITSPMPMLNLRRDADHCKPERHCPFHTGRAAHALRSDAGSRENRIRMGGMSCR